MRPAFEQCPQNCFCERLHSGDYAAEITLSAYYLIYIGDTYDAPSFRDYVPKYHAENVT